MLLVCVHNLMNERGCITLLCKGFPPQIERLRDRKNPRNIIFLNLEKYTTLVEMCVCVGYSKVHLHKYASYKKGIDLVETFHFYFNY
jgi:hypothetical protein